MLGRFCILVEGAQGSDALEAELKAHVRHEVGPIAVPAQIEFVDTLPKTRSGKIMRRVLKAKAMGQPLGDLSTLGRLTRFAQDAENKAGG